MNYKLTFAVFISVFHQFASDKVGETQINKLYLSSTIIANLNMLGLEIGKVSVIIPTAILQSMKLRDHPRSLLPALSMHLIGERTATIPLHHLSS